MKPEYAFFLALTTLIWCACEFSAGTKKDLRTGLSVSNKGFSFDDSYLAGPDNTRKADNKVPLNSTVAIVVEGIDHYVLKDGGRFPA